MNKPKIAITMGDPAGIGAEITVKALNHPCIYQEACPLVIGSRVVLEDAMAMVSSTLQVRSIENVAEVRGEFGWMEVLDLDNITLQDFSYGKISPCAGQAAMDYIFKGIQLAQEGFVDAVVTGPIHKKAIQGAGYSYAGHTEIFAQMTNTHDYAMMLASEELRVIHVSTHVSLRQACDLVKKERVLQVIHLADQAVKKMGIENPRIGVAGLNPHAGEEGLFGVEEIEEIIPAIKEAQKEGLQVEGPVPPDTLFSKVQGGQYHIAVAMYHDQGHIPLKVIGFQYDKVTNTWSSMSGVNATVGLPIIRTSVDHGVAFGKAGEGRANEESMVAAIKMATELAK